MPGVGQVGVGAANRSLSWLTLALFVAFGVRLVVKSATQAGGLEDVATDSRGLARIEGRRAAALNTEGFEARSGRGWFRQD